MGWGALTIRPLGGMLALCVLFLAMAFFDLSGDSDRTKLHFLQVSDQRQIPVF
jgi:hypothetical protein